MRLPYRILVLDDDDSALAGIVELLRDSGYLVTGATTYDAAKRLLALDSYDLLITDIRLRGFNGLHLVRQSHRDRPEMGIIIISGYDEPMIEVEAGRYGAEFVRKPIKPAAFLDSVARSLADVRRQRRWPRKRVVGGFRVTANGRPAAVVDVCYGGLRLEVPEVVRERRQAAGRVRHRDCGHWVAASGRSRLDAAGRRGRIGDVRRGARRRGNARRADLARHRRSSQRVRTSLR